MSRLSWQGQLWLMLSPFLVGALLLLGLPALMSAGLAFTSYDALSPPVWVGFRNFRTLAADPLAGVALTNTLIFVLLAVPLRVLGALRLPCCSAVGDEAWVPIAPLCTCRP